MTAPPPLASPTIPGARVKREVEREAWAVEGEAWSVGIPVLVNQMCAATMEHCRRSGGGLWFTSYPEFEATLGRLVSDASLRAVLGSRGRAFVDRHFRWPVLVDRYDEFLTSVVARGRGTPGLL